MQTASLRQDERALKYGKRVAAAERRSHGAGPVRKRCRSPASALAAGRPGTRPGHELTVRLALVVLMLLAMPREAAPLPSIEDCSADETTLDENQCRCPAGSWLRVLFIQRMLCD